MESQDMDCSYQKTPNRSDCKISFRRRAMDRSTARPYKTVELHSTAIIETMPSYSETPPKPAQQIKNPFEQAWLLKEKLSQPTCSPSLFQKVLSPINKSSTFSWSVDEISVLRPAPIDENPTQEFASWFSPDTESQAQAAIDCYFLSLTHGTLESPVVKASNRAVASIGCQTEFSFPPNLPSCLEAELEGVFSKIASWVEDPNKLNSSNCSARRKLLDLEVYPPSDNDLDSSISDEEGSLKPVFAATPIKRLPSSPECSPIRPDNQSMMDISQICNSPNPMEESGFQSQNSMR